MRNLHRVPPIDEMPHKRLTVSYPCGGATDFVGIDAISAAGYHLATIGRGM